MTSSKLMLAPSQWETSLRSNAVSHWLGANLESALMNSPVLAAAFIRPRLKTSFSLGRMWKFLAPPVTEMSMLGGCNFQCSSIMWRIKFSSVMWSIRTNWNENYHYTWTWWRDDWKHFGIAAPWDSSVEHWETYKQVRHTVISNVYRYFVPNKTTGTFTKYGLT